jgi:hypothetical protein
MEPNSTDQNMTPAQAQASPGSSLTSPALIIGGVVAVAAIAALLLWQYPVGGKAMMDNSAMNQQSVAQESWMPATSGNSDDAASIQADLEATNMNDFESLMNADTQAAASGI